MAATSPLGPAVGVEGLLLQVGNSNSPETFTTIANVTDIDVPTISETQDVTNVGDLWRRRFPTLHDMGKISCKIFWVPEESTHRNSATGLRYMMINNVLKDFQLIYNDGNNATDAFPAYVTSFHVTGKVGGVLEATVEFSNSGAPSLV